MPLTGYSILVVEDEPIVALDVIECFREAGARVYAAVTLSEALRLVDVPDLSAAVVDFGLHDAKGTALCERLNERQLPYILYTGYAHVADACRSGTIVAKPASPNRLVKAIEHLIKT